MATNTPALLYRNAPVLGATATRFNISNKAITTNLATITTSAAHGLTSPASVGTLVTIQGVDSTHDGTWVIYSIPSTTTFTYVSTTATQSSTAVSPTGVATFNNGTPTGFTVSNKVCQNYVATLTTSAAHGLAVGDMVAVTLGDTIYDGTQLQVIAVPSTTTFSYISATATGATTAVSQGTYAKYPPIYTVPASTTTIATNIVVTNKLASATTFTVCLDSVCIAYQQTLAANSTASFDLKQVLATTKTIMAAASSYAVNVQVSGMTVV
jgi:hypothetical protein